MRNRVQLITYADRFGGTLSGLAELLRGPLAGLFGGVHVLPFFPSIDGADAGFDPIDHTEVDPRLGGWEDVSDLAATLDVMADLIVNHVSALSGPFRDFLAHGESSPAAGMFLTFDKVFPDGATEADLLRVYRPRPGLPLTTFALGDRSRRIVWTTFTSSQIDLDVRDWRTLDYLGRILDRFAEHGVAAARLDAVGYAVKTPGTSCFMTPETFAFIDELTAAARIRGIEVLVEIHSHYEQQLEIASRVDLVYDFALPPLVLHALFSGNGRYLRRWLEIRPRNAVTVLDTHDGIGVLDVAASAIDPQRAGLLPPQEIHDLVERIHFNSNGSSRDATGIAASNVDLYQVNCTYYDALGRDDRRYLLARLLQLFVPGVPQIYYVGLLAGTNDTELLARTSIGRDINRHRYLSVEISEALTQPVVSQLLGLIRFRNSCPAFDGEWTLGESDDGAVAMAWRNGHHAVELSVDLSGRSFQMTVAEGGRRRHITDLASLAG